MIQIFVAFVVHLRNQAVKFASMKLRKKEAGNSNFGFILDIEGDM